MYILAQSKGLAIGNSRFTQEAGASPPGVQGGLWRPRKNQGDPSTGWKPVPLIVPRLGGSRRSASLMQQEGMFLGEVGGFQDHLLPQAGARVDEDGAHQIGGGFGRPSRRDGQGDENL